MAIAGTDIGADYTQSAIVQEGELLALGEVRTGFDLNDAVDRALADALEGIELDRSDLETIVATGEGRKSVDVDQTVTSYNVIGLVMTREYPATRTVLLMGAKNAAALKIDETGRILDFDENDKCAAGVGRFLSDLTRFLDMGIDEIIEVVLEEDEGVDELNTQCSVFAESDVISLIHEGVEPSRIAKGVHTAIAERNASLVRRVGIEEDIMIVGGVGRNEAFIDSLKEQIETPISAPENPAHVAAYGAALSADIDDDDVIDQDIEVGSKQSERFAQTVE